LDGSEDADRRLKSMLFWDVNNGISRRSWARNEGAIFAIKRAMEAEPNLKVTLPNFVDESLFEENTSRLCLGVNEEKFEKRMVFHNTMKKCKFD